MNADEHYAAAERIIADPEGDMLEANTHALLACAGILAHAFTPPRYVVSPPQSDMDRERIDAAVARRFGPGLA